MSSGTRLPESAETDLCRPKSISCPRPRDDCAEHHIPSIFILLARFAGTCWACRRLAMCDLRQDHCAASSGAVMSHSNASITANSSLAAQARLRLPTVIWLENPAVVRGRTASLATCSEEPRTCATVAAFSTG